MESTTSHSNNRIRFQKQRRFGCVYLPSWSIDLVRRQLLNQKRHPQALTQNDSRSDNGTQRPLLLTTTAAQQTIVTRCCPLAMSAGVREGMSVALASALVHSPLLLPYTPERDVALLRRTALRCLSITPLVGIDSEIQQRVKLCEVHLISRYAFGIILEVTGMERIYTSEEQLCRLVTERFQRQGVRSRVCIAGSIGAAWALSRFGPLQHTVVPPQLSLREAISPLPLPSLRIDTGNIVALQELGITRIEELLKLPTKMLASRFGLHLLRRIHQATGAVEESYEALLPDTPPQVGRSFEIPLTRQESITTATVTLFSDLFRSMALRGLRAASYILAISSQNDYGQEQRSTHELSLNAAIQNPTHLLGIITPVVENLRVIGGVTHIQISTRNTERRVTQQPQLFGGQESADLLTAAEVLLSSLSVRLGKEQLREVQLHEQYLPERSFSYEQISKDHSQRTHQMQLQESPHPGLYFERPPYLLTPPEQITVVALLPDKPPAKLRWRGIEYTVAHGIGPERITPPWWQQIIPTSEQKSFATRDYFTVQDNTGRWLWVYRSSEDLSWKIHGLWS